MNTPKISGLTETPKRTAQGAIYRGRFTCPDVQWTESAKQSFCTFTITAGQLTDAADGNLLWTDQAVQRGIQPTASPRPPRELSLAAGYPNSKLYIFDVEKADAMVSKLLQGEQLFLSPLIWNLRPGHFDACWWDKDRELFIYSGRIYLPDSHHRHQAIAKAVRLWRSAPDDYPSFDENTQFKVELYFLSTDDEGNYFYDKNQLSKPTAKSKAFDLTTADDLSLLAKLVIEKSTNLRENVNRVTDRLDSRNPQVVTLSTLREMMRTYTTEESIDSSEMEGLATLAAEFYDLVAAVRPELGKQDVSDRKMIRATLVVDAAVMMHGYASLMKEYNVDVGRMGPSRAKAQWGRRLSHLSKSKSYTMSGWSGDFFDKNNPLWSQIGVTRTGTDRDRITVLNTGAARIQAGRVLRQLLALQSATTDLSFLAKR